MANEAYLKLLRDPRWQRLRLEVMKRDDFACTSCGDKDKTLHIHHKRYVRGGKPWDSQPEDLTTLCEACHETITNTLPFARDMLACLDASTLQTVSGMLLGIAFKRRDPRALGRVEFSCYEMVNGFARETHRDTDKLLLALESGSLDMKKLAAAEDEESARLDAEYLAPGGAHDQWLKGRQG